MSRIHYMIAIMFITVTFSVITGCVINSDAGVQSHAGAERISIDGCAPMYPVIQSAANDYMANHAGVKIAVYTGGNNTAGIQELIRNATDICDSDQAVTDSEYQAGRDKGIKLHMTEVGSDAVCVIANPAIPVTDLNLSQLNDIFFTGNITDWGQVTDWTYNGTIHVYAVDTATSGDSKQFSLVVSGAAQSPYVTGFRKRLIDADVAPSVATDRDGIGFVSLKFIGNTVNVIRVNGIYPSGDSVRDTTYPISLHMYMITRGPPEGLAKDFINYMLSTEGQKAIKDAGFISFM